MVFDFPLNLTINQEILINGARRPHPLLAEEGLALSLFVRDNILNDKFQSHRNYF